jgi:dCMP deaminase
MALKETLERKNQFTHFYMNIAMLTATLSYSKKRKVGAVIVKDRNIISYGFNGTITGLPNITERFNEETEKLETLPWTIHAEMNAVLKAGAECKDADMYVTVFPCNECMKLVAQAGIKTIFYYEENNKGNSDTYGIITTKL